MASDLIEIEHKYIVSETELLDYVAALIQLVPERSYQMDVEDCYFIPSTPNGYIYRYRHDEELNQLTVKSLECDTEVRLEIDLDLKRESSSMDRVEPFLQTLGIYPEIKILKSLDVFYFSDCEVVCYKARTKAKEVCCLEIEARKGSFRDREAALAAISRYENLLKVDPSRRSKRSLFEILHAQQLS